MDFYSGSQLEELCHLCSNFVDFHSGNQLEEKEFTKCSVIAVFHSVNMLGYWYL